MLPADWWCACGAHGRGCTAGFGDDLQQRTSHLLIQLKQVLVDLAAQYRKKEQELQEMHRELGM